MIRPDYDSDPGRFASLRPEWLLEGDVHPIVAERVRWLDPVLDVGGGTGLIPGAINVDSSPAQLAGATGARVRADARRLPFADGSAGAVAMLWMLYHLEDPVEAIAEAHRVLRPGGIFVACTASRTSDPELTDGYPKTTFDAEEAGEIVGRIFRDVEVERWDGPFARLPDDEAVAAFCRSHFLEVPSHVEPPITLTKRGCLVYASKGTMPSTR